MATKNSVEELRDLAKGVQSTPISELLRNSEWGSINFDKAKPDLEEIVWPICNELLSLQIELIPEGQIGQIHGPLGEIDATIDRIRSFQLGGADPKATRDEIVNALRGQADNLFTQAHGWIPYLALKRGDVEANISKLQSAVEQTKQKNDEFEKWLDGKKTEVEKIVADTREMAGEAGVAQFTTRFSAEADNKRKEARRWLLATCVGGLVSVLTSVAIFVGWLSPDLSEVNADTRDIILIQSMTTKFILLGILLSATFWCGRQYNVLKHLQAQNQHRADSLKTFQAFTQAANEPAGRDAVLIEATKAIFGHTPSGYIKGSDSDGDSRLTILEVLKQATKPDKPE